jgi:hypothetical protein
LLWRAALARKQVRAAWRSAHRQAGSLQWRWRPAGETCDKAGRDGVAADGENNRDRLSCRFRRPWRSAAERHDHVDLAASEIGGQCGQLIIAALSKAVFDRNVRPRVTDLNRTISIKPTHLSYGANVYTLIRPFASKLGIEHPTVPSVTGQFVR